MNRPTFENTISILVKAYMNDELEHKTCGACAVGNIVAAAIGTKPKNADNSAMKFDNNNFENNEPAFSGWYTMINGGWTLEGYNQVRATGYTISELKEIEYAFENAQGEPREVGRSGIWPGKCTDPTWMFNGLMAVVEVLAEIHGVDLNTKESAKLQFVKL